MTPVVQVLDHKLWSITNDSKKIEKQILVVTGLQIELSNFSQLSATFRDLSGKVYRGTFAKFNFIVM